MEKNATAQTRGTRRKRLASSLTVTLGLLVILELIFRLFGWFAPDRPFTVFTAENGVKSVRYNWNGEKPEFSFEKPAGTFRIMVAGESTALGFPYHPRSSFGLRLQALLGQALPGPAVEVLNFGRMSLDSARVAEVVSAALKYQPDLILVYSGQNEFLNYRGSRSRVLSALRRALENLRVFQAVAAAMKLGTGTAVMGIMQKGEEDPQALALPPPTRMTPADYEKILAGYRSNLTRIAAACQKARVPLVLFTMATNLRDWPPDLSAFPAELSDPARQAATAAVGKARELMDQRRFNEAVKLLAPARDQAGYAPLDFELGRARTALLEERRSQWRPAPGAVREPEPLARLRREALEDFKLALAEEARTVVSHRAPPEVSELVRDVAITTGAWLVDTERVMEAVANGAPGFDWYDDHCHPTLRGQQVIAEATFTLLRLHDLPRPRREFRELPAWDEAAFARAHGLDNPFLHGVYLRLGIFLGLQKDLPDSSAATRDRLALAAQTDPADPLPVIAKALVGLNYGETREAQALVPWYSSRRPALEQCLARYFTSAVDLRQGVFMAKLPHAVGAPPLRGLLKSGLFQKTGAAAETHPPAPPSSFTDFLDLTDNGRAITSKIQDRLAALPNPPDPAQVLVLADPRQKIYLQPSPGAILAKKLSASGNADYFFETAEAFLTTGPVRILPLQYPELVLQGRVETTGAAAGGIVVAWTSAAGPGRTATVRETLRPVAGRTDIFALRLADQPRWLLASEVLEIKLAPVAAETRLSLQQLSLRQVFVPPAD